MTLNINPKFKTLLRKQTEEERKNLEQLVLREGIREPILVWRNTIVDGHNRYEIAEKHSLSYRTEDVEFRNEFEAIEFIIANQFGRRNLTENEKSYLRGQRYENEKAQGERKDLTSGNCYQKSETSEKLAKEYNTSEKTIRNDANFAQGLDAIADVEPELKDNILANQSEFTKKDVQEIARKKKEQEKLEKERLKKEEERITQERKDLEEKAKIEVEKARKEAEKQAFLKEQAEQERIKRELAEQARIKAEKEKQELEKKHQLELERIKKEEQEKRNKAIQDELKRQKEEKERKKLEKQEERRKQIAETKERIEKQELQKPTGLYEVVVIDPPWQYEKDTNSNSYNPESRRVANPYPEMSLEQIKQIEIPCKKDSFIFLWTTHKYLPHSFDLLKNWGFDYKATLVWDKEKIGMGHWFRMQCEFCLFAIKGKPVWDNTKERDIFRESRRQHSRKPDEFYRIVEDVTYGRKLDYFAREQREGWDIFGAETNKY